MDNETTVIRWDPDELRKEHEVSRERIKASVVAAVEEELEPTVQELHIAASVGVTREELMQQKAMDRLTPQELRLMRTGMTAIEILASRIVR